MLQRQEPRPRVLLGVSIGIFSLVGFGGGWVWGQDGNSPREEKSVLSEAQRKGERPGFVYFRGKWIRAEKVRFLENLVKRESPQHTRNFTQDRFRITKPDSDKWAFACATGSTGIFTLMKREGVKTRVQITAHRYLFEFAYAFSDQLRIAGDNPSGLLKGHQADILRMYPGTRVRKKMWRQRFRRDMRTYRTVLTRKDGTVHEIICVPSMHRLSDRTFLFVVHYSPGEYVFARTGVESIMRSLRVSNR